jgi:hypothetical protein
VKRRGDWLKSAQAQEFILATQFSLHKEGTKSRYTGIVVVNEGAEMPTNAETDMLNLFQPTCSSALNLVGHVNFFCSPLSTALGIFQSFRVWGIPRRKTMRIS